MKRMKHLMVDAVVIPVAGGPLGGRKCGCSPRCHSSAPVTDTLLCKGSTCIGEHLSNPDHYLGVTETCLAPLLLILKSQKDAAVIYFHVLKQVSLITYNLTFDMLGWGAVGMLRVLQLMRPTAHVTKSAVAP